MPNPQRDTTVASDEFPLEGGIDLFPASASPTAVCFAHRHRTALLVGLGALAAAWAAWTFAEETLPRVAFTLVAGFIALQAIAASTYRYEVTFDPQQRRWRRRMGRFYAPSTATGSMEDLKAVVLTIFHVSQGSGSSRHRVPRWRVALEMKGEAWTEPLIVGIAKEEQEAYRLLEVYARRLRVDAADRTHDTELRRSWDELDHSLAGAGRPSDVEATAGDTSTLPAAVRGSHAASVWPEHPPAGSDITVTAERGRCRLTLAPAGFLVAHLLQLLLGVPFAIMGAWSLVIGLRPPLTGDGPADSGAIIFGSVFAVIGVRIALRTAVALGGREWVVGERDRICFGITGPLGTSRRRSLAKREIEEVVVVSSRKHGGGAVLTVLGVPIRLGGDPAQAGIVRVRADREIVYLGTRLSPEGRAWLRDALQAMIDGQVPQPLRPWP